MARVVPHFAALHAGYGLGVRAPPAANGLAATLNYSHVGTTRYLSAAGFPGRTVGLTEQRAEMR
jgi:hypothetical protein